MILSKDPKSVTFVDEIFGPVISVGPLSFRATVPTDAHTGSLQVYVYEDDDFEKTLDLIDETTEYALTGAMYVEFCIYKFPVFLTPHLF